MYSKKFFLVLFILVSCLAAHAVPYGGSYAHKRTEWLRKAQDATPALTETISRPLSLVTTVEDASAYQGWRVDKVGEVADYYSSSINEMPDVMVDFGRHMTGYFTFRLNTVMGVQDAPIRLRFTFGEVPSEMAVPFDPFPGSLSRAWMQDEVITLYTIGEEVTIPRRISGRYMRIEVLGHPLGGVYSVQDMYMTSVSSVDKLRVEPLGEDVPEMIRRINDVSVATLRECMQTVFEDGPKRDRRLWVGDLYLESLANRHSFRNFDLVKRCLYLFAGLTGDEGCIVPNIFEHPEPHCYESMHLLPYSLLFNSTLLEYLKDTQDYETAEDLWCVAVRQIEDAFTFVNKAYLYDPELRSSWIFFDWRAGLDVTATMQAAMIFALNQTYELAQMLGKEAEVKEWKTLERNMLKAARKHMYDKEMGVVVSGPDRQVSVLSQAWMTKAGVLDVKEAQKALRTAMSDDSSVKPGTPYATHYVVDAMLLCGMNEEAKTYMIDYWGGMVNKGADTFWEAYDPNDDYISPYNFHPLNSYCHAWSCTPVYFIYTYPEIFQK
jgi:hypothetical protein